MQADVWRDWSDCCRPRTEQRDGSEPCSHGRRCLAGEKGLFNKDKNTVHLCLHSQSDCVKPGMLGRALSVQRLGIAYQTFLVLLPFHLVTN